MNRSTMGRALSALLFVFTLVGQADALARQDVIKREFDVAPGGTLVLDIDLGAIEVRTHRGSGVNLVLERDADGDSEDLKEFLSRQEFRADRRGNDVIVELFIEDEDDGAWRRWKRGRDLDIRLEISVPEEFDIEFRSGAGNVDIADLHGRVEGRTGAGNVVIGRVQGSVEASSGAGNISLASAEGRIRVQSGAGNITLDRVRGEVQARTGAGNVEATITDALDGRSSFDTGAGNVTVTLADGVGADVDAHASMGSARTDYDLRVRGGFMSKSFSGRVNGGGPEITMSAGVGNVTLRKR